MLQLIKSWSIRWFFLPCARCTAINLCVSLFLDQITPNFIIIAVRLIYWRKLKASFLWNSKYFSFRLSPGVKSAIFYERIKSSIDKAQNSSHGPQFRRTSSARNHHAKETTKGIHEDVLPSDRGLLRSLRHRFHFKSTFCTRCTRFSQLSILISILGGMRSEMYR